MKTLKNLPVGTEFYPVVDEHTPYIKISDTCILDLDEGLFYALDCDMEVLTDNDYI